MDTLGSIRSSFGDSFTALPLLIMGLIFFLGMLTSNIGLLYLFIGHFFVVPAISYLGNETGHPMRNEKGEIDATKLLKWITSLGIFFGINSGGAQVSTGSWWTMFIWLGIIPAFFQIATGDPLFHFYNPLDWRNINNSERFFGVVSKDVKPGLSCDILPSDSDVIYNKPSHWVNHISFFFGFIMSNTIAVYNEPTPKNPATADPAADAKRKAQIDMRVGNRKSIAGWIGVVSTFVFIFLLFFRYKKTDCEENFWLALVPIVIVYFTGFAFFELIYRACGVRPADVLGIVQGMISSQLIDNPIVCVGTP
jgi:hypothetical protein